MQNVLGPLINLYQAQLDISRKCADAVFSGTEKIDRVMIGATHRMFSEQMNLVQALASVRDPRAVGDALQMGFRQHAPDDAMDYQKEIMRIFADMQNEIGKSLQGYVQEVGGTAATAAAKPLQSGLDQTNDTVFNPMTSMFSVWESAFKDVAALAKKNMAAARPTADQVAAEAKQASVSYPDIASGAVHGTSDNATNATANPTSAGKSSVTVGETAIDDKKGAPSPAGGHKRR